jgi:catechol 2,3-dioxygenase-like lactoylglutathione lyase family enzyme
MIGRLHHLVLDCPDPDVLAAFYSELLGWPVTWQQPDWVVIARNDTSSGLAFQPVPDYRPPRWPDPQYPQQLHFDVMVDDLDSAERSVLALGARRLRAEADSSSRVFADPAGHPFCLISRPSWAPPISAEPQR